MEGERNIVEQRYAAVMAVSQDGQTVSQVAQVYGMSRQTLHKWLRRYDAKGMAGLINGSHRPKRSPRQAPGEVEAAACEMRRRHAGWGPRRIAHELAKQGTAVSRSTTYRILVRQALIEPHARRRRPEDYKRWERSRPMELWQMDVVGGVLLTTDVELKMVTAVDDHSRFCVSAKVIERATAPAVCNAFVEALRRHGVPEEMLTDNGKVFTNRYSKFPMLEAAFDRICRENGIVHRLTKVRTPTTTGKIERFHRTLREELLSGRKFTSVEDAQAAVDVWVGTYNAERPHQSIGMLTPLQRFHAAKPVPFEETKTITAPGPTTDVERRVNRSGTITICRMRYTVGSSYVGRLVTARIEDSVVHCVYDGKIVKTLPRRHSGEIVRPNADRKHRSRRAADVRRREAHSSDSEAAS
jgi:transposase InsO family protein